MLNTVLFMSLLDKRILWLCKCVCVTQGFVCYCSVYVPLCEDIMSLCPSLCTQGCLCYFSVYLYKLRDVSATCVCQYTGQVQSFCTRTEPCFLKSRDGS